MKNNKQIKIKNNKEKFKNINESWNNKKSLFSVYQEFLSVLSSI